MGVRIRRWLGIEELGTKITELRDLLMNGAIGVGAAMARKPADDRPIPTRLVECRNGHGVIGQVWSVTFDNFIGSCPDCGDCPNEVKA
jgi:hypothetical protein